MAQRQSNATRQDEYKRMTKDELLKVIARHNFCFHLDADNRAVYETEHWSHLPKTELVRLAANCC